MKDIQAGFRYCFDQVSFMRSGKEPYSAITWLEEIENCLDNAEIPESIKEEWRQKLSRVIFSEEEIEQSITKAHATESRLLDFIVTERHDYNDDEICLIYTFRLDLEAFNQYLIRHNQEENIISMVKIDKIMEDIFFDQEKEFKQEIRNIKKNQLLPTFYPNIFGW